MRRYRVVALGNKHVLNSHYIEKAQLWMEFVEEEEEEEYAAETNRN